MTFCFALPYVPGVYVPPGAGIGTGVAGPGTGFFPGKRASSDCLNKKKCCNNHNQQSLFALRRFIAVSLYSCIPEFSLLKKKFKRKPEITPE